MNPNQYATSSIEQHALLLNLYTKEAKTKIFRCRKCLNLAYLSTRKTKSQRLRSKQFKLKEKLEANLLQLLNNGLIIPKPKGMHISTYLKILLNKFLPSTNRFRQARVLSPHL